MLTEAERAEFRRRAQEAAAAPECSGEAEAFLVEARGLMRAHPHDSEIAIAVAAEALRSRQDDLARESMLFLTDSRAPWDWHHPMNVSLASPPAPNSVDGALLRLWSAGIWSRDEDEQSQFRAALLDAAWLLLESGGPDFNDLAFEDRAPAGVQWSFEEARDRAIGRFETDAAIEFAATLAASRPWLGEWRFETAVQQVLYVLRRRASLHDSVIEHLVSHMLRERDHGSITTFELEIAEACRGQHARVRCLARLASSAPSRSAFLGSNHAECLRRAVDVARELRSDDADGWSGTEAGRVQAEWELCEELARAYVRIGAPIDVPAPNPSAPKTSAPESLVNTARPRGRTRPTFNPFGGLPGKKAEDRERPHRRTQPSEIEPLLSFCRSFFPEYPHPDSDFWPWISKVIEKEREKVAGGLPAQGPEKVPTGFRTGGESEAVPVSPIDRMPLPQSLLEAEEAISRGELDRVGDLLRDAFEATKIQPTELAKRRELHHLFGLAIRIEDLALAEAALDEAFTVTPVRPSRSSSDPDPELEKVRDALDRWSERDLYHGFPPMPPRPPMALPRSAPHELDHLVATLSERITSRGEPQRAACAVRRFASLGASSRTLSGFAIGRLNFARTLVPSAAP